MIFKFLIFSLVNPESMAHVLQCSYSAALSFQYSCDLFLFTLTNDYIVNDIKGTHVDGKSDEDVVLVAARTGSYSPVFPTIICDKYQNIKAIKFRNQILSVIKDTDFKSCENLEVLDLTNTKILSLPENFLASKTKLTVFTIMSQLSGNISQ